MTTPAADNEAGKTALVTIGVIADTHIPDRVHNLHPMVLPVLRAAGVSHILHAGDICSREVLNTLHQVAPVTAVRGNRDILIGQLRMIEELDFGGVRVALMHGHGGWLPYLWDKVQYWLEGYRLDRYLNRLIETSDSARVVVFGHTHHPEIIHRAGKLLFNPGSASFGPDIDFPPTIGLLYFYPGGEVQAVTRQLTGYTVKNRKWVNE